MSTIHGARLHSLARRQSRTGEFAFVEGISIPSPPLPSSCPPPSAFVDYVIDKRIRARGNKMPNADAEPRTARRRSIHRISKSILHRLSSSRQFVCSVDNSLRARVVIFVWRRSFLADKTGMNFALDTTIDTAIMRYMTKPSRLATIASLKSDITLSLLNY